MPDKFPPRRNVFIGGYSGDLNDGRLLSLDWGCTLTQEKAAGQARTNCKTAPGSSGTPVLLTGTGFQGDYIVSLHAWGSKNAGATAGGPLASRFFRKIAELRDRIGLPSGVYSRRRDSILPSSREVGFESTERGNCQFAGRFVYSIGIDVNEVEGDRLRTRLTGAHVMVVYKDVWFEYTIDGRKAGSNEHDDDWDFIYGVGGFGHRFMMSRVESGSCT
jgi:hypothetical protein